VLPQMPKPKCLFILGPTASGKTDLAMGIADQVNARLISVDSALIYRDMNIGTAKPTAAELGSYPHDLVNIIDPHETYSVARFIDDAKQAIQGAVAENKLPILVGGTMLYFKGLIDGLSDIPEADLIERQKIEHEAEQMGWPAMHTELQQLDPEAAANIDPNHSQRIGRALEICRSTGMTLTELLQRPSSRGYTPLGEDYELCQVGLNPHDRSDLHSRINLRFEQMLQNGFIEEVEQLRDKYPLTLAHASMRCVGYRQVWQHLEGEFDREELILRGQAATRQLAKRQLTWMRKWPNLNALAAPYSPSKVSSKLDLVEVTLNCLNSQLC
jgi:tRNA dimethylallyltransferase